MTSSQKITRQWLIKEYMLYVLENNSRPKNVYLFAASKGFKEQEFYSFFGSFDALEAEIFVYFHNEALAELDRNDDYEKFDVKTQLMSYYYAIFEIFANNRSFVLFVLENSKSKLKTLKILSELKNEYKIYLDLLEIETTDLKLSLVNESIQKSVAEISWAQFLFTLRFWINDTSPGFEKTDELIEKGMNTGFDLLKIRPLENLVDFGQFLWNETFEKR